MNAPLKVGDIIKVGEADYCYGLGDLILRVTAFVASDLPDPQCRPLDALFINAPRRRWRFRLLNVRK